ncbi:hypothetical protein BC628DRAFT_1146297 [Trametes gibbosa]|nr:hypothetical protein BC628DRAFT_1146297 [Trametes gibbosa]
MNATKRAPQGKRHAKKEHNAPVAASAHASGPLGSEAAASPSSSSSSTSSSSSSNPRTRAPPSVAQSESTPACPLQPPSPPSLASHRPTCPIPRPSPAQKPRTSPFPDSARSAFLAPLRRPCNSPLSVLGSLAQASKWPSPNPPSCAPTSAPGGRRGQNRAARRIPSPDFFFGCASGAGAGAFARVPPTLRVRGRKRKRARPPLPHHRGPTHPPGTPDLVLSQRTHRWPVQHSDLRRRPSTYDSERGAAAPPPIDIPRAHGRGPHSARRGEMSSLAHRSWPATDSIARPHKAWQATPWRTVARPRF